MFLVQRQGIQCLPFYFPATHVLPQSSPSCSKEVSQVPSFTAAETERFQVRFEEGYDLTHDERYNLWLRAHHPNSGPGVRKELSFDWYITFSLVFLALIKWGSICSCICNLARSTCRSLLYTLKSSRMCSGLPLAAATCSNVFPITAASVMVILGSDGICLSVH